jgi:hypothetical protein
LRSRQDDVAGLTGLKAKTGVVDLINTQGMDRNLMAQIIKTYLLVILLVSLGFFGVGALATAQELRDPMQPPPFALQKYRETGGRPIPGPPGQ